MNQMLLLTFLFSSINTSWFDNDRQIHLTKLEDCTPEQAERRANFVIELAGNANPRSDEDTEDMIKQCEKTALTIFSCTLNRYFYYTIDEKRVTEYIPCSNAKTKDEKTICNDGYLNVDGAEIHLKELEKCTAEQSERRAAFILKLARNSNPMSDEEPEDMIKQCEKTALRISPCEWHRYFFTGNHQDFFQEVIINP